MSSNDFDIKAYARSQRRKQESLREAVKSLLPEEDFSSFHRCGLQCDGSFRPSYQPMAVINWKEQEAHIKQATCGNSFICPCCSSRIMREKSNEIGEWITAALSAGWFVYLITHTVPHNKDSDLKVLMRALSKATGNTYRSRSFLEYREEYGYEGVVKCFDYTFNDDTGHHPHLHNVMMFQKEPPIDEMTEDLFNEYKRQVKKLLGKAPSRKAFSVEQIGDEKGVSDYLTKLKVSSYITKQSKEGILYPFDLLIPDTPLEELHRKKFVEYAYATKGMARVRTSKDFGAKRLIEKECKTDKPSVLSFINLPYALAMLLTEDTDMRDSFLTMCENQDWGKLGSLIQLAKRRCPSEGQRLDNFYLGLIDEALRRMEWSEILATEFEELTDE